MVKLTLEEREHDFRLANKVAPAAERYPRHVPCIRFVARQTFAGTPTPVIVGCALCTQHALCTFNTRRGAIDFVHFTALRTWTGVEHKFVTKGLRCFVLQLFLRLIIDPIRAGVPVAVAEQQLPAPAFGFPMWRVRALDTGIF